MAVRGDGMLHILQRAGHTVPATAMGYVRLAESVKDGFGELGQAQEFVAP